ncbi:hypothetical protein ABZ281_31900 [Streptomyces sp. NPDC006265]|uniref:hypothetical protein n=1 Tax=Streptomyces sp. NPDC006265 TaxID=3156740 RepID=UPI0033B47773
MQNTRARMLAAVAPTGRTHPLLADTDAPREHAEPHAGPCPTFRDCTVTEPGHTDHYAHDVLAVLDERNTSTVLDAGMVALSDDEPRAVVCIGVAEFTDAAAVHAKTAELRRMLDQVDAMADRVFADHEARG